MSQPSRTLTTRLRRLLLPERGRPDGLRNSTFMQALTDDERALVTRVHPLSLTNPERIIATHDAVEYALRRKVPGALVECGVWRGGMVLAMILTLQENGVDDRDVYLYDTFEGMTTPSKDDVAVLDGESAVTTWEAAQATGERPWEAFFGEESFSLEGVQNVIYGTGYPPKHIHFVVGAVEETLPDAAPEAIALLRLDTDWYESTRHELVHLYPRLSDGGVLIIDDYGHWLGCRKAVDEYFASVRPPLLVRTDYTARMGVKH